MNRSPDTLDSLELASRNNSTALVAFVTGSFVFVVNVAPLALGGNRILPWAYNSLFCGGMAIVLAVSCWLQPATRPNLRFAPIVVPVLLFIFVLIWIAIQASPSAAEILGAHPAWVFINGEASGGEKFPPYLSVNPAETGLALVRLATYGSVFLTAFILSQNASTASHLLKMFALTAGFYAILGLVRLSFGWDRILWIDVDSNGYLTSTFINRNSAATYFGLASVTGAAALLRQIRREHFRQSGHRLRYRLLDLISAMPGKLGIVAIAFALPCIALLLTASRGGILAAVAGLASLMVLTSIRRSSGAGSGSVRFAGIAVISILLLSLFRMSGGEFWERLVVSESQSRSRLATYQTTIQAIADNSVTGTGFGTFQDVFPLYRNEVPASALVWDKAHNDYLELFLGLGIPAGLVFLTIIFLIFRLALRGYFVRRKDAIYPGIAVAATIVVGVHSLVDFSAQIQAVAMAYAMLLGIGAAQATGRQELSKPL